MTKRFYVTMTWDNWPEGGSYGTIIEAEDYDEAEELCRREMAAVRGDGEESADVAREMWGEEWQTVDCFDLDEFIEQHKRAEG